ncbi:uncharacterized protein LOC111407708 [Olea europaea var. sylvestris]|uniref:uncharacterized protein LOC111407708 n=1 Tax=Olea europaea var. sylvestris TaxID=158386 RepID=UPI000C1CFDAF|nr:uncharacterized protein LOC111407708 [Olea europaea var. sylvestris]
MTIEKGNIEEDVTLVSQADAREVVEGKVFHNKEILKMSLVFYVIQNKFEYNVLRSDKKEYIIKCSHNDCKWIFRSSRLGETKMFKIRKMCNGHTCSMNIVLGSHRQASSLIVSNCIKYKYTSSRTIYTPNDMLNKYGVSMNYMKAWRSHKKTLKLTRGDLTTSFQLLPFYFFMLKQMNIGTVTRIETDHLDRFKYCFMALGVSIAGCKYCRPIIVVDGTYLNGHYRGTLFTACTQDANNNIFILAFGIGDNENNKSWRWFLEMLKRAYGSRDGLCIVSDRHSSIRNAIEFVYSEAMHGIFSYHLLKNLKTHCAKSGHNVTHAFNSAIRAYTLNVGYEKWSRLHMPTNRYSTMTSNIVESVNAVAKVAKNYPIRALLESLSCRMFQVDQLPCPHALTVIATLKRNVYDFCSVYYTRYAYLNTYKETVFPIGNKTEWNLPEDVSNRVVLAPDQKRSSGRPTEKRKKSAYERSQVVKCGRFGESSHNRQTCRNMMSFN